jgi:bifunctional N-acetylglucosamine-1-phosphate-uridyltransferase/glucosamine-1-phosphate-acetyltransferase GlmU-like protein
VLGFRTADKRQYGLLEIDGDAVVRSIEWKYWSTFPRDREKQLEICNSGIYAARTEDLIRYLPILEERPHKVKKERKGKLVDIEEFFITDLVELMHRDGLRVGYIVAEDEKEVMGVDDLSSLLKAQSLFSVHP